jgi:mRNA interferase MazF
MPEVYRGEIYYIEAYMTEGSEQRAGRPAIIVSNDMANRYSPVVEVVYLTTQPKSDMPTHVTIRSAARESVALCEQITSVSKNRIGDYIGSVTDDERQRLDLALLTSLALELTAPAAEIEETPPLAVIECESNERLTAERDIYKGLYEDLLAKVLRK